MELALPPSLRRFRDRPGWLLSLALHLAMVLLALWYLAGRPMVPPDIHVLPVELVALVPRPGPAGALPAPRPGAPRPARAAAPQPEGVRPEATQQPEDELSAKLRALAQLSAPDTQLSIGGGNGTGGAGSGNGAYGLKDFIRSQILRRWLPDLSDSGRRDMAVMVRVNVTDRGAITGVAILDQQRFASDKLFHSMAISARNAALLASPIQMPPGNWPRVQTLDIDLDPKAALR